MPNDEVACARIAELERQVAELTTRNRVLGALRFELVTPLNALYAAYQLLRRGDLDDERRARVVHILDRRLRDVGELVNDMGEVLSIGGEWRRLTRRRLPVADVIDDAVGASRSRFVEREHAFTVELPSEPMWVDADPLQLAQAFRELLRFFASTSTQSRIELRAAVVGGEAVVRVTDDYEWSHWKMDPFMTSSQLFLVRKLVELHDGTVELHHDAEGNALAVRLPLVPAPA